MNEDPQALLTSVLFDPSPEQPNIIAQAVRSNYFNNLLSAPKPLLERVWYQWSCSRACSYFAGSILRKDMKALQRGWMAYSAIFDTQKKSLPYAGQMFKASQNPNAVKGQSRLDLVIKQEEKINQYRYIAEQEAAQGRLGFKFLVQQYEDMQAMAADPVFRLVPNLFTGFDAWTGATLANAQARFRAMDELERLGEAATPARIKELATAEYNSMFTSVLLQIKLLNIVMLILHLTLILVLASKQTVFQTLPGLTPFLTFPTTMMNMVRVADDYILHPKSFQKDVNELAYTSSNVYGKPESTDRILAPVVLEQKMDEIAKTNALIERTVLLVVSYRYFFISCVGSVIKDKLSRMVCLVLR